MKLFLELLVKNAGFRSGLDNSGKDVSRFTHGAKREFDALRGSVQSIQGVLAGLGLSYGFVQNQAASARLDKGLIQIKQTAGETIEMTKELRKEFFRMGGETGRQVEGLKDGFDSLIQSGQSWKAALESTRGINIAHAVTGANEKTLSAGLTVGATAFNIDLEKPGKALELLDKMTVAGRLGNAELENLSDIFARTGINAESAGFKFEKTLAYIEALSMVERQPERLATLADSTLRVFTNLKYMAEAQKGTGVKFFDDKGGRRDPIAVIEDIRKKYALLKTDLQRAAFIQTAFGKADLDTIKGIRTLLSGGSLEKVNDFTKQIEDAGGTLKRDLPEAISNAVDQTGRLKVTLRDAADQFAQPINKAIADLIKHSLGKKSEGGMELSGKELIGIGGGTLLTAAVLKRFGPGMLKGLVGGVANTAEGVLVGKQLEKLTGVNPVFVTNWPANLGSVISNPGSKINFAKYLAPAAMYSLPAAVVAAPFVSALIGDQARENGWGSQTISRDSSLYDVMGIGRRQTSKNNAWQDSFDAARRNAFLAPNVKNDIKLEVRIDRDGRVIAVSNNLDTSINTTVQRGAFDDAIMRPNL